MINRFSGHFWTIAPVARSLWRKPLVSPGRPWRTSFVDPEVGTIRLTGTLHVPAIDTDTLVVALHGLGGDYDSHYIRTLARRAHQRGMACLRMNMRGADMSGDDFYHAGLTADLEAALASEALRAFRRIVLVGYSIGGHIVLRYATENVDPRVTAVAAVCPPLDLAQAARDIDQRIRTPYRRHVLASLRDMLRAIARRKRLRLPLERALRIASVRGWDERLVAPRFGFFGAGDYYRRMSMAGRFDELRIPALIVATRHDPMVLSSSLRRALPRRSHPLLDVTWLDRAGHVGFPSEIDLEGRVLQWLSA
jgi:predicted alpha/beta-fold hydrolase